MYVKMVTIKPQFYIILLSVFLFFTCAIIFILCRCDKGYGGAHCVPLTPLPSVLREDFNENLQQETWPEVYGAERGTLSGEPLKSGAALIFKGVRVLNTCRDPPFQTELTHGDSFILISSICRMGCECLCPGIWTAQTLSISSSLLNLSLKVFHYSPL